MYSKFLFYLWSSCLLCSPTYIAGGIVHRISHKLTAVLGLFALSKQGVWAEERVPFFHVGGTEEDNRPVDLHLFSNHSYGAVGQSGRSFSTQPFCALYGASGALNRFNELSEGNDALVQVYSSALSANDTLFIGGSADDWAYAARVNSECTLEWSLAFYVYADQDRFSKVAALSEGAVWVGSTLYRNATMNTVENRLFIVRLSAQGTQEWERLVSFPAHLQLLSVDAILFYNASIYASGTLIDQSDFLIDPFLIRVSEAGELLFCTKYSIYDATKIKGITGTDRGPLAFVGDDGDCIVYGGIDPFTGGLVHVHRVENDLGGNEGIGIVHVEGDRLVVVGTFNKIDYGKSPLLFEVDGSGLLYQATLWGTGEDLYTSGVVKGKNGSLTIAGYTEPDSGRSDLFIARLDRNYGGVCVLNWTLPTLNVTKDVAEESCMVNVTTPLVTRFNLSKSFVSQPTNSTEEQCLEFALTPVPTRSPSETLSGGLFAVTARLVPQEAIVGDLYKGQISLTIFSDDQGQGAPVVNISAQSIQNQATDWLNIDAYTLSGTPVVEDQLLIIVNVTDAGGSSAGATVTLSIDSSSSILDMLPSSGKDATVPIIVGLLGGTAFLLVWFILSLFKNGDCDLLPLPKKASQEAIQNAEKEKNSEELSNEDSEVTQMVPLQSSKEKQTLVTFKRRNGGSIVV